MESDWNTFVKSLPYEVKNLHSDELPTEIKNFGLSFPCLIRLRGGKHEVVIDSESFGQIIDLQTP